MKCPYCGGTDHFNNSNLNHKFKHLDCNKYFKICPICETRYTDQDIYIHEPHVIRVANLFEIDICNNCEEAWLPDFPTSWTRSLTNVSKIYELLNDLSKISEKFITSNNLFAIQRTRNGVIYNPLRARARGIHEYINGSGKRRMKEYIGYFLNAQILKTENTDDEFIYTLTKFGDEFESFRNQTEFIAFIIASFSNIKLNNGYQKPAKNSVYRLFQIRFMENLLDIAQIRSSENKLTSKYDFGIAVLARDRQQFTSLTLKYASDFADDGLKQLFFKDENQELQRAVISTFVNVFISLGLLIKVNGKYKITDLGTDILLYLKSRPALWYENLIASDNDDYEIELAAKILLWRLVKHNLLNENDLTLSLLELEEKLSSDLNEIFDIPLESTKDLHFNIYYDEPLYDSKITVTAQILFRMKEYIRNTQITYEDLKESCEYLPVLWFYDIYDIVIRHKDFILEVIDRFDDESFKQSLQSGQNWHNTTKKLLNELNLTCIDYKDSPLFNNLIIKKLNLSLPGGTIYNPDMLILEEGFGPRNCILVDSKDAKSINSEVPKLMGYNLYASHHRVNTYCIIVLRGKLPIITEQRIKQNSSEFDRITIIEEEALNQLVSRQLSKEEILHILVPDNGFKHLTFKCPDHRSWDYEIADPKSPYKT